MRSRERVITTLYHEEPDMVPIFDWLYDDISIRRILGKPEGSRITPEAYMKAQRSLSFDLVALAFDASRAWGAPWGMRGKIRDDMWWYIDGTIKKPEDLENFQPPTPEGETRYKKVIKALEKHGEEMAIAPVCPGPFTIAWMMTGFDVFAKALYTNPPFAQKLLDSVKKYSIELGKIFIDRGAEFLWINDDLGTMHGPFIALEHFRQFVLPVLREMVRSYKRRGAWVLLHSDGNVMPLMGDLLEIGIDALHPIERKAHMSLKDMKEKYGDKITLFGNVDASNLLPFGKEEEIDEQIKECFKIAAPGGGYIFGSDHSIHRGIPPQKARFLFNQAQKYRRYPVH